VCGRSLLTACEASSRSKWHEARLEPDRLELYITGYYEEFVCAVQAKDITSRHSRFRVNDVGFLFRYPYFVPSNICYLNQRLFHPWQTRAALGAAGATPPLSPMLPELDSWHISHAGTPGMTQRRASTQLRAMAAGQARRSDPPEESSLLPRSVSLPAGELGRMKYLHGHFGNARHVIGPPAIHAVRRPGQSIGEAYEEAYRQYLVDRRAEVARRFPNGVPWRGTKQDASLKTEQDTAVGPEQVAGPSAGGS
jgi:hypothetical protein